LGKILKQYPLVIATFCPGKNLRGRQAKRESYCTSKLGHTKFLRNLNLAVKTVKIKKRFDDYDGQIKE
jgi:hypothetical protein